jgi:hypothetical protein
MSYLLYGCVSDETFKELALGGHCFFCFPATIIAIAVPWVRNFVNARILNAHWAIEEIIKRIPGKN